MAAHKDDSKIAADVPEACSKAFRVRKTVIEMLTDRGYIITDAERKATITDFIGTFGTEPKPDQLTMLATKRETSILGTDRIFVFFSDEGRLGVKPIKNFFERMEGEKIKRAILVVTGTITPHAQTVLKAMAPAQILEQFQEAEMLVNITKHVLVPQHQLLTDDEKKELLKKYKLKPTQLPRIQMSDPIARYYGLQKGQVVRITRPSETAGRYVTYRLVV